MGTLSMAGRGLVLNNKLFRINLFRYQQFENYQRRSFLSAVLYLWAEASVR
jgi:hypothetical protein